MIAALFALVAPTNLPPPPPSDEPAPTEEVGEAAVGTEEAEVVSEPVNPAATTEVPMPEPVEETGASIQARDEHSMCALRPARAGDSRSLRSDKARMIR